MPRYALRLAYDGTGFAGWARQPGRRTVAGCLDAAFARLGEADAAATGAARTDAGVHARDQVAHVDCVRAWDAEDLRQRLNRQLDPDAAVLAVRTAPAGWDALAAVRGKTYAYRLDLGAAPDPFAARYAWRPAWAARIDPDVLRAAAALVPGRRDWRAFVRRGEQRGDLVRAIRSCRVRVRAGRAEIRIAGDGFAYRLCRSLVGGLCSVAAGAHSLAAWEAALAGIPGGVSRQQAPAHGLTLLRMQVRGWAGLAAQAPERS